MGQCMKVIIINHDFLVTVMISDNQRFWGVFGPSRPQAASLWQVGDDVTLPCKYPRGCQISFCPIFVRQLFHAILFQSL